MGEKFMYPVSLVQARHSRFASLHFNFYLQPDNN
jgi:hypothetical protein